MEILNEVSKKEYKNIINNDIFLLKRQMKPSRERTRIIEILKWSVDGIYNDQKNSAMFF